MRCGSPPFDILYVVVPMYNESKNVAALVDAWYPVVERHAGGGHSRLVILDDGSTDDAHGQLSLLAREKPLLALVAKSNGGHSSTLIQGYRFTLANGAEWIFQTDSDGQTLPSEFESFWQMRDSFDAIFGDRLRRQDGMSRVIAERVLCMMLRAFFGVVVPDANAPYRLMRASMLERYLSMMPNDVELPNALLVALSSFFEDRICFREVSFLPRQSGTSSINARKMMRMGCKALDDFRHIRKLLDRQGVN